MLHTETVRHRSSPSCLTPTIFFAPAGSPPMPAGGTRGRLPFPFPPCPPANPHQAQSYLKNIDSCYYSKKNNMMRSSLTKKFVCCIQYTNKLRGNVLADESPIGFCKPRLEPMPLSDHQASRNPTARPDRLAGRRKEVKGKGNPPRFEAPPSTSVVTTANEPEPTRRER